jgi:putative transposase
VGISTAINWVKRLGETGSVAPGKMGGHKPKAISGEHRLWLLQRIKDGDFTLRGLVAELAERGLKVDYRSVWKFVHGENLSFKKSVVAGERPSRRRAAAGAVDKISRSRRAWAPGLHRRDLDQDQHGAAAGMGAARPQAHGSFRCPADRGRAGVIGTGRGLRSRSLRREIPQTSCPPTLADRSRRRDRTIERDDVPFTPPPARTD